MRQTENVATELKAAFPLAQCAVTDSIALRPLTEDDRPVLTSILGGDPEMTWTRNTWDSGNIDYLLGLRLSHYANHGFGVYGVVDRQTDALIGMAGLQFWKDSLEDVEVIAYISKERWNQGIATTALAWCIERAFDECPSLKRILAATRQDNPAAQAMVSRLGMDVIGKADHWGVPALEWAIIRPA